MIRALPLVITQPKPSYGHAILRNLLAFIFGCFCTLTLAPFYHTVFIIPSFAGLYILIQHATSRRRAFFEGFFWGWGFHITGLYWFCIALMTDPEKFAWLLPFALFGLTAVIAIYAGIAAWIASHLRARSLAGIVFFAGVWTLVEYARGHLFTGFPWNIAGYSAGFSEASLQLASVTGAYGLTFMMVLLGALPALFVWLPRAKAARIVTTAYAMAALAMVWGYGRMALVGELPLVPGVMLRIVQPNIPQHHKWDPSTQMAIERTYRYVTTAEGLDKITHVIWPETAIPHVVGYNSIATSQIATMLPKGAHMIAGALRREEDLETELFRFYNSIFIFNDTGKVLTHYDKAHLVPFGEYLPLRAWLPESLTTPVGNSDMSSGPGPMTQHWPGLPPVSPQICYEGIFPELAIYDKERPEWMLNLTNDAWFGLSIGPHQHFQMVRMRAIEQGIPLVRVANTGISAVVDGYGRILGQLDLGKWGVLDATLPIANPSAPLFSYYGDLWVIIAVFMACMIAIFQIKPEYVNKIRLQVVLRSANCSKKKLT